MTVIISMSEDQPSTHAGWPVPRECRELRVLKHFVDVHNYIDFVCVRFSVCYICVCIVLSISGG